MKQRRAFSTALVLAGTWLALAGGTRTAAADTGAFSLFKRPHAGNPLDPVRVSQATPAPPATPAPKPETLVCKTDDQCPAGTYCDGGICKPVERRISVLLFQKEGPTTWFMPFYWSRTGSPGYRVIAPIYWHFWSADNKSFVFAPFYWHFEDYLEQRTISVVLLYAHTKQPDAESWAFWPIFYGSTKFGWAAPLLGSFRIAHPDQQSGWGSFLFLYWWSRGPGRGFDLAFPLFVSNRSTDSAFTFTLPLNFYWRSEKEKHLLSLPFFYWESSPTSSTLVSWLGYLSTAEGGAKRGALAWIYWFGRRSDSQYDVLFPLLWSFRTPTSNTFVLPPVLHIGREHSRFTTVFPLAWAASNDNDGSAWKLFLPFYFSRTKDHGRVHTWLTPLGGGSRDDNDGTRSLTFLAPPIFLRKDREHEFASYLLLYWHDRDVAGDTSTTLAGLYYSHDDPAGSSRVLFPLFWHFRDAATGATAHSLFPFYFHRHSPDETSTAAGIFPFWGYHRGFTDGGWSAGLTPLAFFGSHNGRSHAVIPPLLFFHFKDQQQSSTVSFPFFYRFADRYRSNLGVIPLLYFQGHDHEDSYHVQIPLFWRFHDGEKDTTTTVIPPLYWRSRPDGWAGGLAPLLFMAGGPQRHFVLFPLFWHFGDDTQDKTTTVFLNYLHRRHGDEVTDGLFPLLWWRRGARPGEAPETSFTLFPLVHYRRTAEQTVFASPVAAWGRGRERAGGFVGPYFWYGGPRIAARGLFPLWFDVTHVRTGERTRLIGPWVQLDGPDHSAQVLFPLAAHYRDATESGTYVFPTFFHRRTKDGYAVDSLLPLFWFSSAPGYSTSIVGPYFHTRTPEGGSTGVVPLFVHAENQHRKFLATPLFYYRRNHDETTTHLFAPLVFHSADADSHSTVVFPLWWSGHKKEKSHAVLFPLFWQFANAKEDTDFTLAGPLLWSNNGKWKTRGLMPVFWYSRNGEGAGSNAVLPLFFERHTPSERLFLTVPFGWKSAPDHKWFYVLPFIYRDGWDKTFWTVLPLAFHHEDKVTETNTTIIPPLLFYNRNSPGKSLTGLAMLFWRQNNITSSMTLGLPLFYDIHSYHDKRLTMLLPLFIRYHNETAENTYTITPLSYSRSSPTDGTHVIFPLFWDFVSPERRTTFLFPFYAGFRRANWEGRYIFPSVWYRTGLGPDAGTYRFFILPFWESAVKRPGDYMWEVLMGFVGWERIGRNRYLKLFFYPFELAPIPPGQQAWRGPQPMPRDRRARGVNTGVW